MSLWCRRYVKELLARADKPGSTPIPATLFSDSFYRFFFFLFSRCFLILFPFGLFSFILTADPADHAHGSIYDFTFDISPEFYFGKGISKALDLHTGQAYESRGDSRISR